jgi:hypothetical protein
LQGAWWEEEEGQEYIQQHFSIKLIAKYFRTSLSYHIFLEIFTPPTYKNMQAAFYLRSRNLQKTVGVSAL